MISPMFIFCTFILLSLGFVNNLICHQCTMKKSLLSYGKTPCGRNSLMNLNIILRYSPKFLHEFEVKTIQTWTLLTSTFPNGLLNLRFSNFTTNMLFSFNDMVLKVAPSKSGLLSSTSSNFFSKKKFYVFLYNYRICWTSGDRKSVV